MTSPDEADLIADLRQVGFKIRSVYDFENMAKPYPRAYPVLVRHLSLPHDRPTREGIVKALAVKDAWPVVGQALLDAFRTERDPFIRWVLANTLRTVLPWRERQKYPEVANALRSGLVNSGAISQGVVSTGERDAAPGIILRKTVASVARHGLPLAALYLSDAQAASYLLLTAFDLSLGLALIVALKTDTKLDAARPARWNWIIDIPIMAVSLAVVAAALTLPIGTLVILYGVSASVDWAAILSNRVLWIAVGLMAVFAATHAYLMQVHRRDGAGRRLQASFAAQVTLIATFFLLCWDFGQPMFYAVPPLYAAILVFYDMRPDFAEELLPSLWPRPPAKHPDADSVQYPRRSHRSKHPWRR